MFTKNKIFGVTGNHINVVKQSHPSDLVYKESKTPITASYTSVNGGVDGTSKSLGIYWNTNYQYYLTGLLPATPDQTDASSLSLFYRDIYLYDSVGGCAVDIQSTFPFSDWELRGLEDDDLKIFNDALDRLNIQEMLPEISISFLTDGFFAGSLIFDEKKKQFMDVLIHDALQCTLFPSPFNNIDPIINVHASGMTKQFLQTRNKYTSMYIDQMPPSIISMIKEGDFELDPLTTLFVGRKKLTDRAYVSYLQRLLPMYLIEKVMFQGTLVEAQRRQRATTHITMGDDIWTPTREEMLNIAQQFQLSENDPLGAWIVTRNSIQTQDIRPGGDFWKWTDMTDNLRQMKLQALGISDAFLSGDACLTGDTLISTSDGLKRIDSFYTDVTDTKWHPLSITVDSRIGLQKTTHWRYSGKKQTYKITTQRGNHIDCTDNHQLLVLRNGELVWVRADSVKIGDLLCVSTRKNTSNKEKEFNSKDYKEATYSKYSKLDGVPVSHWLDVIKDAKVKFDRYGQYYLTEDKKVICYSQNDNGFGFNPHDTIRLNYERYKDGQYKNFLNLLKRISKSEHNKLVTVLKSGFIFTPITSIVDNGVQKVYDLSMEKDPSFVANGLVVHNSYASSESAYSTFVETVASYRDYLTNKLFYTKLFPLIAVINELYIDQNGAKKQNDINSFLTNLSNRQNLKIPKLHWHKELETREQDSQFEMLQQLSEIGVPVALKTWIAAAGLDSQALLRDLAEDKELQSKLDKYKASRPNNDNNDNAYGEYASTIDPRNGKKISNGVAPRLTSTSMVKGAKYGKKLSQRLLEMPPEEIYVTDTKGKKHIAAHPEKLRREQDARIASISHRMKTDLNYRKKILSKNLKQGRAVLPGFSKGVL